MQEIFKEKKLPSLILPGVLLCAFGIVVYATSSLVVILSFLTGFSGSYLYDLGTYILMLSSVPFFSGIALSLIDLFFLLPIKRSNHAVKNHPVKDQSLTVVLTAYNDEESIGPAVKDFLHNSKVKRVIVIDNNSRDQTYSAAKSAGAIVIKETRQGYGWGVFRGLCEASLYEDSELTLLCEGDLTFKALDITKFLAYIPHADVVNGTRIVEQLRERITQLTTFMYYGNFAVGKLLEVKHLGKGTFTDVGTTYKLVRNSALKQLLPKLNPKVNLEFNAHFMDTVLTNSIPMIECPVTFYPRVGISKGGNVNNRRAIKVGLNMIKGIVLGWGDNSINQNQNPYYEFLSHHEKRSEAYGLTAKRG